MNKSVLSLLRRLSTRRYPHLLLSAGEGARRTSASIDIDIPSIDILPAWRSAENPPAAVAAVDRPDRQTNA